MKCTREGCSKVCKNLTGLKKHLSMSHGGWTTEELDTAVKAEAQNAVPAQGNATPAEREEFFGENSIPIETGVPEATERVRRSRGPNKKAQVRMSNALQRFKEKIAEILPHATAGFIQGKLGWSGNLKEETAKTLSEMWEAYLDLLGFDVEAEPVKFKIGGKWFIFTWPIAMLAVTFFMLTDKQKIEPEKPPVSDAPIYAPEPPAQE